MKPSNPAMFVRCVAAMTQRCVDPHRQLGRLERGIRAAFVPIAMLDMSSEIWTNGDAALRLRRVDVRLAVRWTVLAVASVVARVLVDGAIPELVTGLAAVASVVSAVSAIDSVMKSRSTQARVTHMLFDLVRFRDGAPGSGARLAAAMMTHSVEHRWCLALRSASPRLRDELYVPLGMYADDPTDPDCSLLIAA